MTTIAPARSEERTQNELRPDRLDQIIGQDRAKRLLSRACDSCFELSRPLDHALFVGPGGCGKSTFSHALANELGVHVYDLEAPISFDTLMELRTVLYDGDIIKVEEIHQQAIMERRGTSAATRPEVLYAVMEDRVLPTSRGILPYPRITLIGTTTDEGMLPDSFVQRFPLRPVLEPYTQDDLLQIVSMNAERLDLAISDEAVAIFARACRGVPRQINDYMKNALILTRTVDAAAAREVLDLNGIEPDGLTRDMVRMLTFLYEKAKQTTGKGEVRYQASVNSIATAIGKSRDSKAIALRVEPFLIEQGYVQVTHGGRRLTDLGIERAKELA